MKKYALWLSIIALIALAGFGGRFYQDNMNFAPGEETAQSQTVTIDGVVNVKEPLQGIPGTTPPSHVSIEHNGVVYFLLFTGPHSNFSDGDTVTVEGTTMVTQSESPDGTITDWNVIVVDSITGR